MIRLPLTSHPSACNSTLEQAAIPSRSWQKGQDARLPAPARQERAASPLLTSGVGHWK
jgi:hypothetical protein